MSKNSRIYPSWNPSAFRNNSFPDCHWKLCLQFMDRYKNLLPHEQLLALAHIFANTQLLLRGDEDQTMQLVLDLVKDQLQVQSEDDPAVQVDHVANSSWERKAEPEFLESSPVVEMEALDISTAEVEVAVKEEPEEMVETLEKAATESDCPKAGMMVTSDSKNEMQQSPPSEELPKDAVPEPKPAPEVVTRFIRVVPAVEPVSMENVYNNLILIDENFEKTQSYFNRLNCGRLEVTIKQYTDRSYSATVKIDRHVLAQASAKKKCKAQTNAIQQFFTIMRDHCYRIQSLLPEKLLQSTSSNIVPRQTALQLQQANSPERINESNLGFRMLQKIGWTGGPLGANAQGRLDPVECNALRKGRAGIGAVQEDTIDPAHYRQLMKDFKARNEGRPLVFSAEFSNQECAELQRIASQLRLDGRIITLPKGVKRFAVMAKELPPQEIVRRVVIEQDVDLSAQYRVLPPKRSASFSKANNPTPAKVVPDCPKIQKEPKSVTFSVDKNKSAESECDSQLSSEEEDSPVSASPVPLNRLPHQPTKKSTPDPASYSEILDSLFEFKPIRPLRSVDDVFHNMVLVGKTFTKVAKEFKKVGTGLLQFTNQSVGDCGFCARIFVGEIVLVEVFDRVGKKAKKRAEEAFFNKAAMFCYRLTPRNSKKDMRNAIPRNVNPNTNVEYYRDIMQNFAKDCVEQELVFSTEFTDKERKMLQSIADGFNLRAVGYGSRKSRHLRIIGQCLPALAIVERIVVHKDARLSARYEVTPPRIGARVVEGDSV